MSIQEDIDWNRWEEIIRLNGITIDRPEGTAHPHYPSIIYPIDYGFIEGTIASDGDEIDIFVGSTSTGLVGLILTQDHRKGDREVKLIFNCSPKEIYLVSGFINFDRSLMEGELLLRQPLSELRSM